MSLLFLLTLEARAECILVPTLDDLVGHLADAESAYVDLDLTRVDASVDAALFALPCVAELVPPALAARYHRILGLRMYGAGQEQDAMRALGSAKALEPEVGLSEALVPMGHVLRDQYDRIPSTVPTRAVPEPRRGTFAFDGSIGLNRPVDRFTVFQLLDDQAGITGTLYLGPTDPLPAYETRPTYRVPIAVGTGAGLVVAGALYGVALGAAARWKSTDFASEEELLSARRRVNALAVSSAGVAGVSVLGGGIALLWTER